MKSKLIFRVDANAKIGRGHLSRSLAIASMLDKAFEVLFVSLEQCKNYIQGLNLNYELKTIEKEEDIFEILTKKDFVWLDGYQFTEHYKKIVQSKVSKLIETNDIPYNPTYVDVLFNHTPGLSKQDFGETKTDLYLGLDYALLRSSFLEYARKNTSTGGGEGVFICFGGADTYNLGYKFVQQLMHYNFEAPIYWITHQRNKDLNLAPNVHVLSHLDEFEMIDYMTQSKVLLMPSSVLSFEAIALRKPIFTGYFVDNQKRIFEGLKKNKIADCFGYLEKDDEVTQAVLSFLEFYKDEERQDRMINKQKEMIDGKSGKRIEAVLKALG